MEAAQQIDRRIAELPEWQGQILARLRELIREAEPRLNEEWKWNSPTWTYNGNAAAFGAFKDHIKINFFKGAELPDPKGLFNAGLDAKKTRSIDLYQGDTIDEGALKDLIRAAAAMNAR